jgi:hypothetical protein
MVKIVYGYWSAEAVVLGHLATRRVAGLRDSHEEVVRKDCLYRGNAHIVEDRSAEIRMFAVEKGDRSHSIGSGSYLARQGYVGAACRVVKIKEYYAPIIDYGDVHNIIHGGTVIGNSPRPRD